MLQFLLQNYHTFKELCYARQKLFIWMKNLLAETDDISESTGPNMYIGNWIMGVPKMVRLEHDGNIKTILFFKNNPHNGPISYSSSDKTLAPQPLQAWSQDPSRIWDFHEQKLRTAKWLYVIIEGFREVLAQQKASVQSIRIQQFAIVNKQQNGYMYHATGHLKKVSKHEHKKKLSNQNSAICNCRQYYHAFHWSNFCSNTSHQNL